MKGGLYTSIYEDKKKYEEELAEVDGLTIVDPELNDNYIDEYDFFPYISLKRCINYYDNYSQEHDAYYDYLIKILTEK